MRRRPVISDGALLTLLSTACTKGRRGVTIGLNDDFASGERDGDDIVYYNLRVLSVKWHPQWNYAAKWD